MDDATPPVDKHLVRRAFDRAAAAYDEAAVLQHEVGRRMDERLDLIRMRPSRLLDIGAGTGRNSEALRQRYPRAELVSADLAPGMVAATRSRTSWWQRRFGRQRFAVADIEAMPFADASFDLVFSNLTIQWCTDLDRTFREVRRVLRPGGLFMFSTFGPDTLRELRAAWSAADGRVHVNTFIDMHDIGDALVRVPLADPVMDMEHFTLTYPDVFGLMRDLKAIGAHNVNTGRGRGMTGRRRVAAMAEAYEEWRGGDGTLPATYEVVYGHAWAPQSGMLQSRDGDVTAVPLSQLRAAAKRDS